jgi:hypothetical protein
MMKIVCVLALVALAAADPWNGVTIASTYINLGASNNIPASYDCNAYAALFTSDGILHAPGVPDCVGTAQIAACCEADHNLINPLISYLDQTIAVQSWDTTKRLGFSWMINGVRASDGVNIATPAISAFWLTSDALITSAFSFYDDQALSAKQATPPFNPRSIIYTYMNLGATDKSTAPVRDCGTWAGLFTADGVSNEPGIPPFNGTDKLMQACSIRSARFPILVPTIDTVFPVESWDTTKRVAFQWTLTGVDSNGTAYVVPSITIFYMTPEKTITASWDFWDTDLLPSTEAGKQMKEMFLNKNFKL